MGAGVGFDIAGGIGSALGDFQTAQDNKAMGQMALQEHLQDRDYTLQERSLRLQNLRQQMESKMLENPEALAARDAAEVKRLQDSIDTLPLDDKTKAVAKWSIAAIPADHRATFLQNLLVPKPTKLSSRPILNKTPGQFPTMGIATWDPSDPQGTFKMGEPQAVPGAGRIPVKPPKKTPMDIASEKMAAIDKYYRDNGLPPLTGDSRKETYEKALFGASVGGKVDKIDIPAPVRQQVADSDRTLALIQDAKAALGRVMVKLSGKRPPDDVAKLIHTAENDQTENGIASLMDSRVKHWALYKAGISEKDWEDYIQFIAAVRAVGMQPFFRGRMNQSYQRLILQHFPDALTMTPEAARNRLLNMEKMVKQGRDQNLIDAGVPPTRWDAQRKSLMGAAGAPPAAAEEDSGGGVILLGGDEEDDSGE